MIEVLVPTGTLRDDRGAGANWNSARDDRGAGANWKSKG